MRSILTIAVALAVAAGAALAQCPGCPSAGGCGSMSQKTGGLAGLMLVSLAGDTVKLSDHIGMMPMVVLLAGTGEASGKAADIVQAAVAAQEQPPMLAYVLVAGPRAAKAFAKSHSLTGMVPGLSPFFYGKLGKVSCRSAAGGDEEHNGPLPRRLRMYEIPSAIA